MATTYSLKANNGEGDEKQRIRLIQVDAVEAQRIIEDWRGIVAAQEEGAVLTAVDLGCRKYTEEGIALLREFLTPELVSQVTTFIGDDMIASIPTDIALRILTGICSIFADSPLEEVVLSDNALGNRGLTACDSVLQRGLKKLLLCNNGLSKESMEVLLGQLQGSTTLETLHVWQNMIGPEGAEVFAQLLATLPALRDLRYAQNRAGRAGTRAICEALAGNMNLNLESFDIEGGKIYAEDGEDAVDPFCVFLRGSEDLCMLNIGDCELKDQGMVPIAQAIVDGNAALETLVVKENDLTADSCEALCTVLTLNIDTLVCFDAEANEFTSLGVRTLFGAYERNAVLQRIDLSQNELGHGAAVALARAPLSQLMELVLSDNGFPLRDVTRLQRRYPGAVLTFVDNEEDAEYDEGLDDKEDEELEEELEAANANPQAEEEDEGEEFDPLDMLSQALGRQHIA